VLATERTSELQGLGTPALAAAVNALSDPGVSVVEAALAAAALGATALHDPTEGGLAAGLHEVAQAAGVALRVNAGAILWFAPGLAVCTALGADPWATLASGAVLAAFPPDAVVGAIEELRRRGHLAVAIAEARPGAGVRDTTGRAIPCPARDEVARVLSG